MRIRPSGLALVVLLVPAVVTADDHRADRFAGFTRSGGGSSLFGIHVTDAITIPNMKSKDLALLADLSVHFGSHNENDMTRVPYLVGLRWTFAKDNLPPEQKPKFLPFVHGLVGGVYTNNGAESGNSFAGVIGAGFDYVPRRGQARREGWAVRVQFDYIGSGDDFTRFSTGLVYRFKP